MLNREASNMVGNTASAIARCRAVSGPNLEWVSAASRELVTLTDRLNVHGDFSDEWRLAIQELNELRVEVVERIERIQGGVSRATA